MMTQKTILFKLALEKYEEIYNKHMLHLENQQRLKMNKEKEQSELLEGKYKFFE